MPNLEVGRLALLGGGILVVVLVLALLARSCSGNGTSSANEKYLTEVKSALHLSDQAGAKLATLTRAARPMQAQAAAATATAAADLEKQAVQQANAIKPTKQAEAAQGALIQALSYRQQGLTCLAAALPPAYKAKAGPAAASITPCMQQLLASDVVYLSSYQGVLNNALSDAHVDARAPSSVILPQSSVPTVTSAGATQMLQRLKPGTATHGLHGMSLDTVIAQSGGQNVTLRPGGEVNQVKAQLRPGAGRHRDQRRRLRGARRQGHRHAPGAGQVEGDEVGDDRPGRLQAEGDGDDHGPRCRRQQLQLLLTTSS